MLRRNPVLCFLGLSSTGIGNEGVRYIAEGLIKNKTLLSLLIANNEISVTGAEQLERVLPHCALEHLELNMNPLQNAGIEKIANVLRLSKSRIRILGVSDCKFNFLGAAHLY